MIFCNFANKAALNNASKHSASVSSPSQNYSWWFHYIIHLVSINHQKYFFSFPLQNVFWCVFLNLYDPHNCATCPGAQSVCSSAFVEENWKCFRDPVKATLSNLAIFAIPHIYTGDQTWGADSGRPKFPEGHEESQATPPHSKLCLPGKDKLISYI